MIINVIHDPLREDRFELLQKEIRTHQLNVVYWPAIKDPVMGFRGISRAHKQIVKWAMNEGLPEVFVMEDDCYFLGEGAFDYYISKKPDNYDLYLGNVFDGEIDLDGIVQDFSGLTLYGCSKRFYATFLSVPEENHLDRILAGRGRYIVCDPMVCSQQAGFSDNKQKWDSYDRYLGKYRLFGR